MKLFVVAGLLLSCAVHGQTFPIAGKPVRIVVPFPAGGQTDIQARAIAAKMSQLGGGSVIVENKPGASTIIGAMEVIRSAPDGHTRLYTISSTAAQNPHLFSKLPYEPFRDLTPVMFAARSATILVAPANAPFSTVGELIAYAKANPGKVKMLAIADDRRYPVAPDVPTMSEAGVSGFDKLVGGMQFFGPGNIPRGVLAQVNAELARVLRQPDVAKLFVDNGNEVRELGIRLD